MGFASHWKEIAVVLAALCTVASIFFDVRDQASNRITIWGHTFFGFTILLMIGRFYAQWKENAREALRNKQSQDDMLKVIQNTNRNVYDISRVLQPLGKSNIRLTFKPNGIEVKEFCDAAVKKAERDRSADDTVSISVHGIDWSPWRDRPYIPGILLVFFKDPSEAKKLVEGHCLHCESPGDLSFKNFFFDPDKEHERNLLVNVFYHVRDKQLTIAVSALDFTPSVGNDKLLSTIDLPGSTLIISASNELFKKLTSIGILIQTDRGQTIDIENPTMVNVNGETIFEYVFPESMQH